MYHKTEEEIMKNWKGDSNTPVVSVCCATYNHESYITEAIEGFLMQETNFPFEILIRDDFSTDKTTEIIKQYDDKYPTLIKPIFEKENQYVKGVRPMHVMMIQARGEYLAICEGDDYWTDFLKLQKQVDFLEENKDYVISGHDAFIVDENGKHLKDLKLPEIYKKDFDAEDLILTKAQILTLSWVFRNVLLNEISRERRMVLNGDTFLISLLGHHGKSKYHSDIKPAGYRVHTGGVWSMLSKQEKYDESLNTFFWMYRYYNRIGEEKYTKHYLLKYQKHVISSVNNKMIIYEVTKRVFKYIPEPIKRILRPLKRILLS